MKLAMRQLSTQQPLLIDDSPVIQTSSIVRRCCFHNRNHCVVQNEKDPYQRSVLIRTIIHELDSYDKKKEFYLTEFLSCLYFAIPSFRSHFIDAFHLVLLDQVELCVEYEERCNVGELSQFIINTRNTQAQELDARWSDGNSPDFDSAGFGFCFHKHLEFLLSFCSRYFIRPFPVKLLKAILVLFRTSIILVRFVIRDDL